MGARFTFTFELKPGMIVADDVHSVTGLLIAEKNTILTDDIINLIKINNITDIKISDGIPNEDTDTISLNDKLVQSQRFKEFQTDFANNIDSFKNSMNDIISKNAPIDAEELNSKCSSLLNKTGPGLEIFIILENMKKYDDSTYTHCINVALISTMLGRWLNFSEKDLDILMLAGMLHDIGKLTIPDEVLNKPGALTPEEYAIIKKHSLGGYNILKDQNIDERVKKACLLHHERCDGNGYPFGLKADKIPAFAKIVTIADVYDAMTAKRCYHEPFCPFKVIAMLEDEAFQKYDPLFIKTFLENVVDSYINYTVRLSDGRIGKIVMINKNNYARPVIKCGNDFIDLSVNRNIEIEQII